MDGGGARSLWEGPIHLEGNGLGVCGPGFHGGSLWVNDSALSQFLQGTQ